MVPPSATANTFCTNLAVCVKESQVSSDQNKDIFAWFYDYTGKAGTIKGY